MDAIDIGNAGTAAGRLRHARPSAYGGFGGPCPANGAAKAFCAGIADNPFKSADSRKEIDLDCAPKILDFVPSGLEFVPAWLGFRSIEKIGSRPKVRAAAASSRAASGLGGGSAGNGAASL
jgi:hypothetical protein